ncbi:MAG: hypothetical protein GY809_04480, partial [Planctomycetes bacterium]|nr:hypothetical protein [Planctomycetota bacterium]
MTRLLVCLTIFQAGFLNAQEISLVPQPTRVDRQEGVFTLDGDMRIVAAGKSQGEAAWLKTYLKSATGLDVVVSDYGWAAGNTIQLEVDPSLDMKTDEGYALTVKPKKVQIKATGIAGIFYGMQTLRQLLSRGAQPQWTIPCVKITDQPS